MTEKAKITLSTKTVIDITIDEMKELQQILTMVLPPQNQICKNGFFVGCKTESKIEN